MNLRRRVPRRITSLVVVVSLLFAQFALASYVCPAAAGAQRMSEMMARGTPCHELDAAAPLLCRQHAVDASQSFEMAKLATPTLPILVQVLVVSTVRAAKAAPLPFSDRPEGQPPPDPVFLQTLRLRV